MLHVALRAPRGTSIVVDGKDVVPEVHAVLDRMADFSNRVRSGEWKGHTGKRIRNIINIGIGGSDLGPVMAYEALKHYSDRALSFRFVSNVDGTDLVEATRDLDPAETLFIVSSKTFTTLETMTNAESARRWSARGVSAAIVAAVAKHFVAVSTNAAEGVGVRHRHREHVRILGLGGRPLFDGFGDRSVDHARHRSRITSARCSTASTRWTSTSAPRRSSAICRCCSALLTVWYTDFFGAETVAVLPYEQYLKRFPAYLQQLTMESNGKHVTLDGHEVDYPTGPIYWGEPGTNGQHSFYQLIHQGTRLIPCDFIAFAQTPQPARPAPRHAAGECVRADRGAGVWQDAARRSRPRARRTISCRIASFEGNRPSNTILAERLTPAALGKLVALYEHSVFTQGVIWNIDSFDQWGVELGKVLAQRIIPELESETEPALAHDSSTNNLIRRYRALRSASTG